jgi:hypothetical protein
MLILLSLSLSVLGETVLRTCQETNLREFVEGACHEGTQRFILRGHQAGGASAGGCWLGQVIIPFCVATSTLVWPRKLLAQHYCLWKGLIKSDGYLCGSNAFGTFPLCYFYYS